MITFSELGKYGRLGNQLFEISTVLSVAHRNNDTYIFPPWEYEQYFNLHNCFSTNIKPTITYAEPYFHYAPIPFYDTKSEVLDIKGYLQSWRYWENYEDVIRGLLTPKNCYGIKWGYTSIHVRRGDYITTYPKAFAHLGMDYFRAAMDRIKSEKYIIVSDDIGWCRQNFVGSQFEFSDGRSVIDDLKIQVACENCIISNSSFSWWAAFLNKNPSKIIVAPNKWFGPELAHHNTKDLIPSEWIRI